ncbi:MAG: AAA family ATPase [Clostridia bacterium]|nr:AAA family ATPase [Clostridia bacterium]
MYIKELHIAAFGPVTDKTFKFDRGLNIIEGNNESGKSAIAMFIKFIFYGLSTRAVDGQIPEKARYINWSRGIASGYAICEITDNGKTQNVRVERTITAKSDADGKTKYSEKARVIDNDTSMPLSVSGQPGVFFFGVPEGVFVGSAFAAQEGDIKPDGSSLKDAVENMISAADENVNVKKAADMLDRARIKLLHKNRTGGEIHDLENRRDEIEIRMENSKETSSRLIRAEVSLADVKQNIATAEARRAELEAAESAIDVFADEARILKADMLRTKLADAKRALENTSSAADDNFMSSLAVAVRDIEKASKLKAELDETEKKLRGSFVAPDRDPEVDADAAAAYEKGASRLFTTGTVLLIVGLLAIIVSAGLKFINNALFTPLLAVTGALVIAGIVTMIISGSKRRKSYRILDEWDADDCDHMFEIAASLSGKLREIDNARVAHTAALSAAKDAEDTLEKLAAAAGIPTDGIPTNVLIKHLAKYGADAVQKKKALAAEISNIEGQLSATIAAMGPVSAEDVLAKAAAVRETEIGSVVASMTEEEKSAIKRELTFNRTKTEGLRDRELDLERECAALRAVNVSPATDAEELWEIKSRLESLRKTHDALILASETLSAAGENIRSSVVPSLTTEASRIMAQATAGKYSAIGISPSFDMNFRDSTFGTLELDYLSAGTKDMAYIALRLALVKSLYKDGMIPPVIFDESLASLDEGRVANALRILEKSDVQSFLFTCRSLEGSLAEEATLTRLG